MSDSFYVTFNLKVRRASWNNHNYSTAPRYIRLQGRCGHRNHLNDPASEFLSTH